MCVRARARAQAIIFRIGMESSSRGGVQKVLPVLKRKDCPEVLLEEACGPLPTRPFHPPHPHPTVSRSAAERAAAV